MFSSCEKSTYDIHMEAFVADAHNDILLRAMEGEDILSYHPESHSDIEKFKQGGVDLQVFSIWVVKREKPQGSTQPNKSGRAQQTS